MKYLFNFLMILLFVNTLFAQAPDKMSYQCVIRNPANALVASTTIGMKISILQGSSSGTPIFIETHTPTTNANGLATLAIGTGTAISGTFAAINWGTGPYFIKTETDPLGGTAYTITAVSQLLSVPYAKYAEKAGGMAQPLGKTYLILTGNITNAQAIAQMANELGPNTQFIWIVNTTALTSVNLSGISDLVELKIKNNTALSSVNLNGLTNIYDNINVGQNNALTSLSLPLFIKGSLFVNDNPMLISISLPSLTSFKNSSYIISNNLLTSISVPSISSVEYLNISDNPILPSVAFPALTSISSDLQIHTNALLTNISLPALITSSVMTINYNAALTSISLPSFISGSANITNNAALTTISMPSLTTGIAIHIFDNLNLSTLSIPLLSSCDYLDISNSMLASLTFPLLSTSSYFIHMDNNTQLTSVSFPALTIGSKIEIAYNPVLTSVSLPVLNSMVLYYHILFRSNALPSSQINSILNKMLTVAPISGKQIELDSQIPSAPPTGAGITDKATLISLGNNVYTD